MPTNYPGPATSPPERHPRGSRKASGLSGTCRAPCHTATARLARVRLGLGFMYSPASMDGMDGEIGKPGQPGAGTAAFDPSDVVAMSGVAEEYRFSFVAD